MQRILWSGFLTCFVTFAQPQLVHAALFTIDDTASWFSSETQNLAPLSGHVEAEWVEGGAARFFRFMGGSSVEVAQVSHRQSIASTALGAGTAIDITVHGGFDVDFRGLAFDIVQGDARNGGGASSLLWRTIGEPPTFHGTLNVAASSPFGNAATTFEYSGLLQAERNAVSSVHRHADPIGRNLPSSRFRRRLRTFDCPS